MGKVQRSRSRSGVDSEAPVDPAKPKAPPPKGRACGATVSWEVMETLHSEPWLSPRHLTVHHSRITCDRDPEFH